MALLLAALITLLGLGLSVPGGECSRASDGAVPVGTVTVGKAPIGATSVGRAPVGTVSIGKASIGATSVGTASTGATSVGTVSIGATFFGTLSLGTSSVGTSSPNTASPNTASPGTASDGAVRGTEVASAQSTTQATDGDPALTAAALRNHRDVVGERGGECRLPPVFAPGTSRGPAVHPLQPARPPHSAVVPCGSGQPSHRHGVRAPPPLSGI
ncbi:hypothetical protein AB0M19_28830 [Streptomyces sp. NPDC051920]|uniref:hypothetical protein n=1 Tax=Streptomyces sp. NPDC051920 TaxID=3155523 RepID=UPI0034461A83